MLSVQDINREAQAVFKMQDAESPEVIRDDLFCQDTRGNRICYRHRDHHGKHAALADMHMDPVRKVWVAARVVTWKKVHRG